MSTGEDTAAQSAVRRFLFDLSDFDPKPLVKKGTWLGKIDHLSATSIGMFRRCPRQWQQRYLKGRKEPPGEAIVVGNFFHGAMQHNHTQKAWSREDRPLPELIGYMQDEVVPSVLNAAGGANEIRWDGHDVWKSLDKARSDASHVVAQYHGQVLPRIQPYATEQRLEWHIAGSPVPIIGYLDVIAEGSAFQSVRGRIIDTKTGNKSATKIKPGWRTQADLYSAWSGLDVEFHCASRAGKINTPLESPELLVHPSQKEAQNLSYTIAQMVKQIEWMYETFGEDDPWPTWGRYADWSMSILPCNYCGYRGDCPAWS